MQEGASAAARTASLNGASRGWRQRAAARTENLQIDMRVPRVDGGDYRKPVVGRHVRRGIGRQASTGRRPACRRRAQCRARRQCRRADPVKLPGPVVTAIRSMSAKAMPASLHHPLQQWHQRFGMTADHRQALARDNAAIARCRARPRSKPPAPYQWRVHAWAVARRERAAKSPRHIGRTSVTSGTKCRSRFWMPCRSVAVDDGQPAHAPFMLR